MLRRSLLTLPLLAALAALAVPAAASAGTVTAENDTLVFRAAPGEQNDLMVNDENGTVVFMDADVAPISTSAAGCAKRDAGGFEIVDCAPLPGGVRVELGDGDDVFRTGYNWPAERPIAVDGGDGNDQLNGGSSADALSGGNGDDKLKGGDANDALDGGAGNDELSGDNGNDQVRGGDGNDTVGGGGTPANADVIDGGAGFDTIVPSEYSSASSGTSGDLPVAITLDGVANDGRPGEGDNVVGVEKLHLLVAADLVGGADPVDFKVFHTGSAGSRLIGTPGADALSGYDYDDTIDGGAGDDTLVGAYGHDTITGGPGRDTITGDAINGCNFLECRPPYGNDTINARDGEVDTISCGIGTDRVVADAGDVVAADCETVERPAVGGGTTPGGTGKPRGGGSSAKKLSVSVPAKLRASAVRKGVTLRVTAPKAGKVTLTLLRGKKTVASGSARAKAAGTVKVRLKARKGQSRRVKKGSFKLVVRLQPKTGKATTLTRTVKLR